MGKLWMPCYLTHHPEPWWHYNAISLFSTFNPSEWHFRTIRLLMHNEGWKKPKRKACRVFTGAIKLRIGNPTTRPTDEFVLISALSSNQTAQIHLQSEEWPSRLGPASSWSSSSASRALVKCCHKQTPSHLESRFLSLRGRKHCCDLLGWASASIGTPFSHYSEIPILKTKMPIQDERVLCHSLQVVKP